MSVSRLLGLGLVTALIAWSGLLLAEGPVRVADDMGAPAPRRHAPRRKIPRKKPRGKPKGAPDAGAVVVAPSVDASATTPPAAEVRTDAGAPNASGPAHAAADEEEEDDDDEDDERAAATAADGGTPRPARRLGGDRSADAGAADDDEEDEDEDEDDEETAYELGAELATESRLVWRGLAESRGAVLQSSAWAGLYGLSVEGFASYLLNTEGPFEPMSVAGADLAASYAFSLGDLRIKPGVALLYFPEGLSSTTTAEVSLGATYRLGRFHVVSGTNVDVSLEPGAYFGTLGLTWGRSRPPWTVKALADVGWATGKYNHAYLGRDVAAIDVVHAGASVRYDLGGVLYVELHVDGSRLVASTLSGSVQEPTLLVGGAAIGVDWSESR